MAMTKKDFIALSWEEIKPYSDDSESTFWFSGIYKVVSYDGEHFHAYYIKDGDKNWGWNPSAPPSHPGREYHSPFWPSLESAQQACERHAENYEPKPATVRRALEVKEAIIRDSK